MKRLRRHSPKFYGILFLIGVAGGYSSQPRFEWAKAILLVLSGYLVGEIFTWARDVISFITRRRR
jgi:hypothetical protein